MKHLTWWEPHAVIIWPNVSPISYSTIHLHMKILWSAMRVNCTVCLCTEAWLGKRNCTLLHMLLLYAPLLHNLTTELMVYSWGLFWPREPGVRNQRRISRSFQGASRENRQAGRRVSSQTRTKLPLHWERMWKWSQSPALRLPSDQHHSIFVPALAM